MSFVNTQYLAYAIVAIIIIGVTLNRLNANFFKWVKSYWFFDRTWTSRISNILYTLSLFLMMTALLDLRGPEKKIKASIPDQRTIILIDSSTSMLAEDVRPNRFVKSLQLARHFVKKAVGHQISIVLFSDIQKRLIPFTDDIDLIDSRLAALEKTNSVAGGSNISQAIEEAIQYFEFDSSDDDKSKSGNMLVFTDAEESEGAFKVNVPTNVNLAVVGVGTVKGANISLRWEDGGFRGYKTFKGEPVITKLDENYIKKMGMNVKSFKYWIVNSFSLPTDEMLNFFRAAFSNKQSTGDLRIRPVFSHYILIPAIILYCLSVLIGRFALFKVSKIILVFGLLLGLGVKSSRVGAEDLSTPEIKKDLEIIQKGKASREYVLKTAEKMLRAKDAARATELYSEYAKKNDSEEVRFNYATSLLKSNKLKEALPMIQDLLKNSRNEDLKDKLRKNLRIHLQQKAEEEKKKNDKDDKEKNQDKKDDKEKQEGKDQKKDGKPQEQKDKQQGEQEGKPENQQNKKPSKDQQNGDDKKDDKKNDEKNKDKENKEEGEEEKQKSKPNTLEEKEREIEKKRRMTKTPAMIKQLMNDDRDLQKKMMDTSTNERGEQKPKRDW